MFPPVHRVPLWVAGYRRAFHELAGEAADGYLARPAESIPAIRIAKDRIAAAARSAGRGPDEIEIGGYLLCLVDSSRRAALDRAKREPFVIYMLAVQSDTAMRRVGLDPELKGRVFAAWREGDYHRAAGLIPDELVDAFILCGTPDEVAARAAEYADAGMTVPVLQPVLQEEDQVGYVLDAAVTYGSGRATAVGAPATAVRSRDAVSTGRRLRNLVEITRPFALTASIVPVCAAGALALLDGLMDWGLFALALVAAVLLQVGTNVINEVYDVRKGIDSITSPRASQALVTGRVTEKDAFRLAYAAFAGCGLLGLVLVAVRGWPLLLIGVFGLVMGWGYTAPPLQYKYRALGLPLVFLLMGPLMVVGCVLRGDRAVVLAGGGGERADRAAGDGDPARQRVAGHRRGRPGRDPDDLDQHRPVGRALDLRRAAGRRVRDARASGSPSTCCRGCRCSRCCRCRCWCRRCGRPSWARPGSSGRSR